MKLIEVLNKRRDPSLPEIQAQKMRWMTLGVHVLVGGLGRPGGRGRSEGGGEPLVRQPGRRPGPGRMPVLCTASLRDAIEPSTAMACAHLRAPQSTPAHAADAQTPAFASYRAASPPQTARPPCRPRRT